MADLSSDILNPEEQVGKFEAFEQNDTTFELNSLDEYPGELPSFGFSDDMRIEDPDPDNQRSEFYEKLRTQKEESNSEQMPDLFEESDDNFDSYEEAEEYADGDDWDLGEEAVSAEDLTSEFEGSLFDDPDKANSYRPVKPQEQPPEIELDGDLKSIIQSELERSDKRKQEKESEKLDFIDSQAEEKLANQEKNSDGRVSEFEFDGVVGDKPSKYGIEDSTSEIPTDQLLEEKEQKKKKIPAWIKYSLLSAAIVLILLSVVGYMGYEMYFKEVTMEAPVFVLDDSTSYNSNSFSEEDKDSSYSNDTSEVMKHKSSIPGIDSVGEIISSSKKTLIEESKIKDDRPKIAIKQPVKKNTSKKVSRKKNQNLLDEPRKILTEEISPKIEFVGKKIDDEGIYSIQIYATLSKDDADSWLSLLREKDIQTGYISQQKIRDKTWYRVRFGNFSSQEEASSVAMRYGFSQSFIDRIK